METSIELAGLTLSSPVTALTNLVLSVQCLLYCRLLRTGRPDRSGYWSLFFLAMAVATLAGVPKHGLRHVMTEQVFALLLWASSLGSAVGVYCAQRATLVSGGDASEALRGLCLLQVTLFVGASLVRGPEMWLVAANSAVGLLPVVGAEALSLRSGHSPRAWVVLGLSVSMLTGVVYVGRFSMSIWFNHVDLAHVLMGLSFWSIARGAPVVACGRPGESVPAVCPPPEVARLHTAGSGRWQ